MGMLIGLVRHGAHDDLGQWLSGRTRDIGLNALGGDEAAALGRRLAGKGIARIVTSPRRRTLETAEILGRILGPQPRTAEELDEIDFGAWSGRRFADLGDDPAWRHWNAARARAPTPGGETMRAAASRARAHLATLADEASGPVLAVSHCDIIRGVVADALGLSLDNILRFEIGTASVSWLRVSGLGPESIQVITVNGSD